MNPYKDSDVYEILKYSDKDEWRKGRQFGIGGSDAAAALGMSKWMSNVTLWQLKTGRAEQKDISDDPKVRYGTEAEEPLRMLFKLNNEDKYGLFYKPDTILINKENPFMRYSPDGLLIEIGTGRLGIFENKTATAYKLDKKLWKTEIPREYYIQVLHGMNVTGAEFVELQVEINHFGWFERKSFHIEKADVLDDLAFEQQGVEEFMRYVKEDKEPPLWIN